MSFSNFSPQGDGNDVAEVEVSVILILFFKLFPARGWKPQSGRWDSSADVPLFQTFPRKGMETSSPHNRGYRPRRLFQTFPRKGMETLLLRTALQEVESVLFQTFPRKGMETTR